MAETRNKGFFGRLFGTREDDAPEGAPGKVPDDRDEAKETETDVTERVSGAPDADAHEPAAAGTFADEEAGADARSDQGGIEPLHPEPRKAETDETDVEQRPTEAVVTPPPFVPAQAEPAQPDTGPKRSWFERLRGGLSRSSNTLGSGITEIFTHRKLDRETLYDFEDVLIQADLGVATAEAIRERLEEGRFKSGASPEAVKGILASEVEKALQPAAKPLVIDESRKPFVILMIGVNGAGKTTTIGKLAARFREEGRKVMLAAGDTFRAAAIEQLQVWGERSGAPVVAKPQGTEAASLAFDAMVEARKAGSDVLIIDTAGRLQNRAELMAELGKVIRVIRKQDETAPHAVLLTLDATTGQNATNQVEIFARDAGVTGLVMTKLDGTARGGILVSIAQKSKLPIHFIGVGEGIDDLQPFAAGDFARAIAGLDR